MSTTSTIFRLKLVDDNYVPPTDVYFLNYLFHSLLFVILISPFLFRRFLFSSGTDPGSSIANQLSSSNQGNESLNNLTLLLFSMMINLTSICLKNPMFDNFTHVWIFHISWKVIFFFLFEILMLRTISGWDVSRTISHCFPFVPSSVSLNF